MAGRFAALADSSSDDDDEEELDAWADDDEEELDAPHEASPPLPGPVCRICQDEDDDCPLLAPCNCAGSMEYVHATCLDTWRHGPPGAHGAAPGILARNLIHCNVCGAKYNFVREPTVRDYCRSRLNAVTHALGGGLSLGLRPGGWVHIWLLTPLLRSMHPVCCSARILLHGILFYVSIIHGRLTLHWVATMWRWMVIIDGYMDELLVPAAILSGLQDALPTLPPAWLLPSGPVRLPLPLWFFNYTGGQPFGPGQPRGPFAAGLTTDDMFTGAVFYCLSLSLCLNRIRRADASWNVLNDLLTVLQSVAPDSPALFSLVGIFLPLCLGFARFLLHAIGVVSLEAFAPDFATGEHVAASMAAAGLFAMGCLAVSSAGGWVLVDYLQFLRSNSGDARDAGAAPPAPPIVPPPRPGARQRQRARRVREEL
jgi:hypothetical protein